ncbi:uncharacterized protein UDID_17805 [Ustilago sp. UG-2017a]|nr:uncharacterized protein UDID_17805 [Ustilago sp. UG-2017a]
MSQSSSISIDASIDTAAAVSSSMIPFTASQIPLAVIKKLGMHSTNAVSNPGHAFPSLVADDLGPSDAIDSDDDFTLLLPAANQTALAAPVDPKVANQLCSFRLRLLQHPALLLCTRPECTHHLPLIPTYVNVFQHLKSHHHLLTKTGVKLLEETLLALDLVSPATVSIKTNLLPINLIKELDTFDGYCCSICKYAVKSSSSAYKHQHSNHDGKASVMHPILIQPIFTSGPFTCYVWVLNSKLEATLPPVTFNINTNTEEDAAFKEQLAAFFAKDAELMAKADLDMEGIQPRTVTGNLSPWLKQLGWQEYWAGKPVAAIGSLGCNPHKWPGAHQDFLHWLLGMTQQCTQQWMEALLQSGRQVQQTFCAFEDTPSHPYSLDQPMVIKCADCWAMLITMLVHVMLDGKVLGYYGDDDQDAHLGISERLAGLIEDLQDLFHDPKLDVDVSMHPDVVVQAFSGIQSISIHLITQDPPAYGELERLPLLCSFLHLCLSPDGTSKPVNAATSMLVNLEFAFRAVMHHHLLHPEHGTLIGKTVPEINKGVQAVMKCYLFNNSYSASAHLQSLLCYGTKLAKDDGGSLYFWWSEDRKLVTYGTNTIKISRLDTLVQGTLDRATSLLEQLLLKDGALSKQVDLSMYKDHFRNREPGYSFVAATQQDAGTFCLCQALKGFPQHQLLLALGGVSCLRTAHNCAPQNFKSTHCALTPTHSKFTLLKCGNANKFIFAGAAQFEQRTAGAAHTLLEQRNFSNTLLESNAQLEQRTARAAHTLLQQRNFSSTLLESNTQLEQHTARAAHTLLEQCNLSSALLESNAQLEQRTARAAHTLLQQRNFSNALLKSNAQLEQRTHSSRAMQSSSPTLALTPHNCSALQHLCRHHQPPLQS